MKDIKTNSTTYHNEILAIKQAVLTSRYRAALHSNSVQLSLYFGIGKYVSQNTRIGAWGTGAIEIISSQLSLELPGIRGFSPSGIKRMRTFYETWHEMFEVIPSVTDKKGNHNLSYIQTSQIDLNIIKTNRPTPLDDLYPKANELFLKLSFSHHYEISIKCDSVEERLFYIYHVTNEFWTLETLKSKIKNNFYFKSGTMPNNFVQTIKPVELRNKTLHSFKDEYFLDFVNIEDDEEIDERVLEQEIVKNIKLFILSFGHDFCFVGNQFRLIVENDEFFIDLLFFNRQLQCLVDIELKTGKFKPSYLGQLNFYLSVLDEYVKCKHENPSIGIILCRETKRKIVELAVRDFNKPMGVATYTTNEDLPDKYKEVFPDLEELKKII